MISTEKPGTPEEILLKHHGIKGQRWGFRKEESTSAGGKSAKPQISARKEKRAKGHESEAARIQTKIDKVKTNPSRLVVTQYQKNHVTKVLEKERDTHLKAAKDIREGHLTDFQKKALVGAGVTAGILAAYGTYKLVDSGHAHEILSKRTPFLKNDLLSRHMSSEGIMREVVKPINPNYGGFGTKMNCRRCTFAYEMRRRGFDVKSTLSHHGTGQDPLSLLSATQPGHHYTKGSLFKEVYRDVQAGRKPGFGPLSTAAHENPLGKISIFKNRSTFRSPFEADTRSSEIFSALSKNPEGARGELGINWHFGGAHSMAWEIIGGKAHIFDTQSGEHFTQETFDHVAKTMSSASFTRLDNVSLNNEFLRRWLRNVK